MLALLSSMVLLSGCPSRQEVNAELWLNTGISAEECAKNPELQKFGIYRLLDTGKYELISHCAQIPDANGKPVNATAGYTSINTEKLTNLLNALLPAQNSVQERR